MPAWCVGCLWTRVGWGEIQQLMPALGPVWFTAKDIFFCLVCPLSPLLRWEAGEEEKVRINGLHRRRGQGLSGPAPFPTPQATCCCLEFSLLLSFALWEALKSLKGHQGVRDTVANHRAWPRPSSKPKPPPTLYRPALHPTCSDTCARFSLGTTINNSRCPGSGLARVQTELSVNGLGGSIRHPPGLPITGP